MQYLAHAQEQISNPFTAEDSEIYFISLQLNKNHDSGHNSSHAMNLTPIKISLPPSSPSPKMLELISDPDPMMAISSLLLVRSVSIVLLFKDHLAGGARPTQIPQILN